MTTPTGTARVCVLCAQGRPRYASTTERGRCEFCRARDTRLVLVMVSAGGRLIRSQDRFQRRARGVRGGGPA